MAADEDVEHDAVDAVVFAVVGDGAHGGCALAEAVDPAFALLVAGGVPGQVVVHDRGEAVLQVDAFGEAVGGDQQPRAVVVGEAVDAQFPLLGRQGAGDRVDAQARALLGQRGGEMFGEVVGGGDVAAEHDGVVALGEQVLQQGDQLLEFGVAARAFESGCGGGQLRAAGAGSRWWAHLARRCPSRRRCRSPSVVSSRSVSRMRGSASASIAWVVSSMASAERLSRVCSAAAGLEARQRSSAMADHQRTRRCTVLKRGVVDLFADEGHDVVEEVFVGGGERVGGFGGLPLRERGVLVEVFADVGALALNHELRQQLAVVLAVAPGQVGGQLGQPGVEQPDQGLPGLVVAGVRGGGQQQQMAGRVVGELAQQRVAQVGLGVLGGGGGRRRRCGLRRRSPIPGSGRRIRRGGCAA